MSSRALDCLFHYSYAIDCAGAAATFVCHTGAGSTLSLWDKFVGSLRTKLGNSYLKPAGGFGISWILETKVNDACYQNVGDGTWQVLVIHAILQDSLKLCSSYTKHQMYRVISFCTAEEDYSCSALTSFIVCRSQIVVMDYNASWLQDQIVIWIIKIGTYCFQGIPNLCNIFVILLYSSGQI